MARRLTNFASHIFASWCYIFIRYLRTANETLHTINHRGLLRKFLPVQSKYFKFLEVTFQTLSNFNRGISNKVKETRKIARHRGDKQKISFPKKCATDLAILIFFYTRQIIFFKPIPSQKGFFDPHSWSYMYPKSKSASDSYRIFTNNLFNETTEKEFFF